MKKLLFVFVAFWSLNLFAQEDTVYLEPLTIQENRIRVPFSEDARSISIINAKQLRELPASHLSEVLSTIAGVDIRSRGAAVQSDVSLRGSTFDETLVLLNGMKMSDPQSGHHLMNLPIGFYDIERVEVLKGAAARIFGQNAYAGAINVITKTPTKRAVSVRTFAGLGITDSNDSTTYQDHGISLGLSLPGESVSQYMSYTRNGSNGHQFNSDFTMDNAFYQATISTLPGVLKVQGGFGSRDFGANGFYAGNNEREKVLTALAGIDYELTGVGTLTKARTYFRQNKDDYKFHFENPQWFHNVHLTKSLGLELHHTRSWGAGTTGLGIEFRNEAIEGVEEEQLAANPLLNDDSRYNAGIYIDHMIEAGGFTATPGVYTNYHQDYGTQMFPGIDLAYRASTNVLLHANAGRTYRTPTFFDLYYSSDNAKTYGDPNLESGVANNFEIGAKIKTDIIRMELTGFIVDAVTTIDWVSDPTDTTFTWQAMNFDNVKKTGAEFALGYNNEKGKGPKVDFNYTYINSTLDNNQFKSRYALSNLKHQMNLLVSQDLGNINFTLNTKFRARPSSSDADVLAGADDLTKYWIMDLRGSYKMDNGRVYLEGSNLLNTQFVEVGTVKQLGTWVRAGLQIDLGF